MLFILLIALFTFAHAEEYDLEDDNIFDTITSGVRGGIDGVRNRFASVTESIKKGINNAKSKIESISPVAIKNTVKSLVQPTDEKKKIPTTTEKKVYAEKGSLLARLREYNAKTKLTAQRIREEKARKL